MTFARVRALVVVGALVVAASVFVVMALIRDSQTDAAGAEGCPDGWVLANIQLPERAQQVKLRVFNGTKINGLGSQVAEDFQNRKFQVKGKPGTRKLTGGVAELHFGPKAYGAAHLLRAYFLDKAETVFERNRKDDIVDVVIGTEFKQLGTTTEVNQALASLGNPVLPAGACAADE